MAQQPARGIKCLTLKRGCVAAEAKSKLTLQVNRSMFTYIAVHKTIQRPNRLMPVSLRHENMVFGL